MSQRQKLKEDEDSVNMGRTSSDVVINPPFPLPKPNLRYRDITDSISISLDSVSKKYPQKRGRSSAYTSSQPIPKKLHHVSIDQEIPTVELMIPNPRKQKESMTIFIGKPVYLTLSKKHIPPLFILKEEGKKEDLMNISFNPDPLSLYHFLNQHQTSIQTIFYIERNETDKVLLFILKNKEHHLFTNTFSFSIQPNMKALIHGGYKTNLLHH